ncbi:hypothetical protein V501_09297, partial [Pseudogymnoascus sp. VKM F-4519 (FW-2642)]
EERRVEGMKERLGLGGWEGVVLPATREDGLRAELAFADVDAAVDRRGKEGGERENEGEGRLRSAKKKKRKPPGPEERKEMLAKTVERNTRVRMDPFLDGGGARVAGGRAVLGVKRKRGVDAQQEIKGGSGSEVKAGEEGPTTETAAAAITASKGLLVDYESE